MTDSIFNKLPKIESFYLSFLKLYTLPDFHDSIEQISANYPFLSSIEKYAEYYKNTESNKDAVLFNILGLGYLRPIKKKHALNSFWRFFRRNGNFALMPMIIKISVKNLTIDKIDYPLKLSVLIFPFGSIAICFDIKIEKLLLKVNDLMDFVNRIHKSTNISLNTVRIEPCNFEKLCRYITKKINLAFLGKDESLKADSSHSAIMLRKSESRFYFDRKSKGTEIMNHVLGIASLPSDQKHIEALEKDFVDGILTTQLKEKWREETILFTPYRTLLLPSYSWMESLSKSCIETYRQFIMDDEDLKTKIVNAQLDKSCRCMFKNYLNCLLHFICH